MGDPNAYAYDKALETGTKKNTTVTASATATARVFQTTELLELILQHLKPRELLVSAQRVCTTWRDTIQRSSPILQRLFYRHTKPLQQKGTTGFFINPFLYEILEDRGWARYDPCHGKLCITVTSRKRHSEARELHEEGNRCSWEDMYPASRPVEVLIHAKFAPLCRWEGDSGTLGKIVESIEDIETE